MRPLVKIIRSESFGFDSHLIFHVVIALLFCRASCASDHDYLKWAEFWDTYPIMCRRLLLLWKWACLEDFKVRATGESFIGNAEQLQKMQSLLIGLGKGLLISQSALVAVLRQMRYPIWIATTTKYLADLCQFRCKRSTCSTLLVCRELLYLSHIGNQKENISPRMEDRAAKEWSTGTIK
jgi:hypothetical protein